MLSKQNVSLSKLIAVTQGMTDDSNNCTSPQLAFLEDHHFLNYVLELCRILATHSERAKIRKGAAVLLKNCIGADTKRSMQYTDKIKLRWQSLTDVDKNGIKRSILKLLSLPNQVARDTAVNVISNLTSIESLNRWKELVPRLINNCLSKNNNLTYSSMKCICQIAGNKENHQELQQYSPKILECIAHAMSTTHGPNFMHVQTVSMECLCKLCNLFKANMRIEKERAIIIQMICCGAANQSNISLKYQSMIAMGTFIEYYDYILMKPYLQSMLNICQENKQDMNATEHAIEILHKLVKSHREYYHHDSLVMGYIKEWEKENGNECQTIPFSLKTLILDLFPLII